MWTYSSRLTLTTQDVQVDVALVLVAETDHDFDTPFLIVFVLGELDFSEQTES